jgi:aspartate/methionine/tyrosine aminotransferase
MNAPSPRLPMDFAAFVEWRRSLRAACPDLVDLAETRIAQALAHLRPITVVPESFPVVHRCHLAPLWCELRGLPPSSAQAAFACNGVRHALELLLGAFAQAGRWVAIPSDVYPVYGRIAAATGVATSQFMTFPDFDLRAVLAQAASDGASVVLLPAPLKLHGRAWTQDEADAAVRWLSQDGERRLVLDGVYAFGQRLDEPILRLLATDQVFYLDSLSKGWLHELVFGIAWVPEPDRMSLRDTFQALRPSQHQLFVARELMTLHGFRDRLANDLAGRREALARRLREAGVVSRPAETGYLVAIEADAAELLESHRILALPASVFGSARGDWSVASALPAVATAMT